MKILIPQSKIQNPKSKMESGFTLLEVVVAMAIVGLGVVTLLEIFSQGLRLESRSAARTEAAAYGRQVMEEFLSRGTQAVGEESGTVGKNHSWRIQVRPVRDESRVSPGWSLNEITLLMNYRDGERDKQLEMRTLRLVKAKIQ